MIFLAVYYIWNAEWAPVVSVAVGTAGIFSAKFCRITEKLMQYPAKAMGYIVQLVILLVVFYLVLTPVALLYRLLNKDPLRLSDKHDSNFIERNIQVIKENLENPW